MDSTADVQDPVQSSPLQMPQTSSPSGDPPSSTAPGGVDVTQHPSPTVDIGTIDPMIPRRLRKEKIFALSRTFRHIPDIPIFTQWDKRMDCSNAAVHRPPRTGIFGTSTAGVYSLALSGSYEDNEDGGDVIIYTGEGGRQVWSDTIPPKHVHCGPQIKDQSWDRTANKALIMSSLTGNPVRVVRSWRCPSQYAPLRGYRYDGLYKVTACWTGKGRSGLKVCRSRLERLPDQPPIPVRPITLRASRLPRGHLVGLTHHSTSTMSSAPSAEDTGKEPMALGVEVPHNQQRDLQGPIYRWYPKERTLVRLEQPPRDEDVHMAEEEERCGSGDSDVTFVPSEASEQTETQVVSDGGD